MTLMGAFLSELAESVPNMLIFWHLIAIASPEVPVKSYIMSPVAHGPEIFVIPLRIVFHTLPENAGVLAKPCNGQNRWLMMPKKDF